MAQFLEENFKALHLPWEKESLGNSCKAWLYPYCRLWLFLVKIHMEMLLCRALLRNPNTDKFTTDCRKFDTENLWPDLWMTPILKYLVCCTQSALIHFRRKPVYPRAENLARCEGLQLMCAITSPAELPKSGGASSFPNQLLGRLAVKNLRLCLFVCMYRKIFSESGRTEMVPRVL